MDHDQFKGIVIVSEGARTLMKGCGREVDITPLLSDNLVITGGSQVGKMTNTLITKQMRELIEETLKGFEETPKSGRRICIMPDYHAPSYSALMDAASKMEVKWRDSKPFRTEFFEPSENHLPDFLDFDKHNHSKFKFDSQGDVNSSVSWEQQVKRRQKSIRAKAARKQNRRN